MGRKRTHSLTRLLPRINIRKRFSKFCPFSPQQNAKSPNDDSGKRKGSKWIRSYERSHTHGRRRDKLWSPLSHWTQLLFRNSLARQRERLFWSQKGCERDNLVFSRVPLQNEKNTGQENMCDCYRRQAEAPKLSLVPCHVRYLLRQCQQGLCQFVKLTLSWFYMHMPEFNHLFEPPWSLPSHSY